jgi:hypothetical protein
MKVSTAVDGSLIVKCENFEGGKEKSFFRMPEVTPTEWGYLFAIVLVSYFAGFNPLVFLMSTIANLEADWKTHQFGSIILCLFAIVTGVYLYYDLFLKTVSRKITNSYRIDRDGSFLPHTTSNFYRTAKIISDENIVSILDEIDLIEDTEACITSTNYERRHNCAPNVRILTNYQVVIKFNPGASSRIEFNGLAVWHCDEDQAKFREFIAETQAAVKQIKSFLEVSKNEITPSSN